MKRDETGWLSDPRVATEAFLKRQWGNSTANEEITLVPR
jgi:hypothetical protein